MLEIKKQKLLNKLAIDNFEFFWINGSQIKTKEQKCLVPVQTPIIEGNRISYYGYIEIKTCKTVTEEIVEDVSF
jgi:hypothetical protein